MTRGGIATIAAILAACLFLAACGQKGPLVLPAPTAQDIPQNGDEGDDEAEDE
ncbi:MAG TPA: lipoprotein [Gammaproteobacteria bacterium]